MRGLLQADRPDGVFCYNDPIASAAIEVVLEAGLRIPEEIAFVGMRQSPFRYRHLKRHYRALTTTAASLEFVPQRCC
jgi:DNA-binding LacI/PurR family transcriptional regulator